MGPEPAKRLKLPRPPIASLPEARRQLIHDDALWPFLQIGGPVGWCPKNKSPAIFVSILGPYFSGSSHIEIASPGSVRQEGSPSSRGWHGYLGGGGSTC